VLTNSKSYLSVMNILISNANGERMRECLFTTLRVRRSRLFSSRLFLPGEPLIYEFGILRKIFPWLSQWMLSVLKLI
jgi:hypothetical protein